MSSIYSLDDAIDSFFEFQNTTDSREECDKSAVSLVSSPVNPVPIQGSFSYTVAAGSEQSLLVQFRVQSSVLDMDILNLARAIHSQVVAAYTYHGTIGRLSPLAVYVVCDVERSETEQYYGG